MAVSTYQAGKLALIGAQGDLLHVTMREFEKPLGLDVRGDQLILATQHGVTLFANAPLLAWEYLVGQRGLYDALFLPRVSYHTGDLNTHEVAFGGNHLYAVNTRFSCLSVLSDRYAF